MRVVIVNTAASSGGALSILRDLYDYIKKNDNQNEWIFLINDEYIESTKNIKVIINKDIKKNWFNRIKWEYIEGSGFIESLNPDVVVSMQNTMNRGIKVKKLIYLHQPLPFQKEKKFSFFKKEERIFAIYQYIIGSIIKKSIKRVDKVIVQTNWMKNALIKQCKIDVNNIKVISPSIPKMDIDEKNYCFKRNKFFYPADIMPYKNHRCIVEAVNILINKGIKNFEVIFTIGEEYKSKLGVCGSIKEIKFIGKIDRKEVFELYNDSILIFPSYIETFGLPILEARRFGSFILASNTEFSKEILQGYENYELFNHFDALELAKYMEDIICGKIKYTHIESITKYSENTWKEMIDEILYR